MVHKSANGAIGNCVDTVVSEEKEETDNGSIESQLSEKNLV